MPVRIYFPADELTGTRKDFELAADYLEISCFFSSERLTRLSELINASEIGADGEYENVEVEILTREELVAGATSVIESRKNCLSDNYPYLLSDDGFELTLSDNFSLGESAYLLCLILSNLESVSPILSQSGVHPSQEEVALLRQYFQYLATAAMAGEVGGDAWSFGFPRPDKTGFFQKLSQIWSYIRDGQLSDSGADGAPTSPKDDQIDVFAVRMHADGLPGYLFAAAQVATGANWKTKSVVHHLTSVFFFRWFSSHPRTRALAYQVIPFARKATDFSDDVLVVGNILHRTRVPNRVQDAEALAANGFTVEAFDQLGQVIEWIEGFRQSALEVT